MNWDAIGAVGEIVGAAAVVLTLLYLALQVRGQNRQSRSMSAKELVREMNEGRALLLVNESLAELALSLRNEDFSEASDRELLRATTYFEMFVSTYWAEFESIKNGTSNLDLLYLAKQLADAAASPGFKAL